MRASPADYKSALHLTRRSEKHRCLNYHNYPLSTIHYPLSIIHYPLSPTFSAAP